MGRSSDRKRADDDDNDSTDGDDEYHDDEFRREAKETLVAPTNWDDGRGVDRRKCTDIPCLVLLLVSWIALTIIGIAAIQQGDYRIIVYPMDYDGNVCGLHAWKDNQQDMTNFPYLLYVNSYTGGVCVNDCPSLEGWVDDGLTDVRTLITYDGIWQTEDGLAELEFGLSDGINMTSGFPFRVANYSGSDDARSCTMDDCFSNNDVVASWTSDGINRGLGYAYYLADTYEIFGRCYYTSDAENRIAELTNSVTEEPLDFVNPLETHAFWTNLYGDLWTARYFILGFGFGVSLLLSLVYTFLLRIPCLLKGLVWTSFGLIIAVLAVAGYSANSLAKEWLAAEPQTVRPEQIKTTEIVAYILYGLAALGVVLAWCFRNSIDVAIGCIRAGSAAIHRMTALFALPFLQGVALLVFWAVWGYYGANLASLGEITTRSIPVDIGGTEVTLRVFEFSDTITYCGWYLLFCFFWTAAFVLAIGDMTVALSVSRWYFTMEKGTINSCAVVGAMGTTLRYHLGTCAFGSLLLAIVRILRVLLMRLKKTVTTLTNKKIASMLLCCCQCCLWCVERVLKFINKNAYIQCAIFATPFAESGRKAFFLLLRNAGRLGSTAFVGGAVLFIGKLFISILTTAVAYWVLTSDESHEVLGEWDLYSYGGPIVVVFCTSYFVASMFMGVFDTGILTVLHCLVADEEMFDGKHADGTIKTWVDEQESKHEEDKKQGRRK